MLMSTHSFKSQSESIPGVYTHILGPIRGNEVNIPAEGDLCQRMPSYITIRGHLRTGSSIRERRAIKLDSMSLVRFDSHNRISHEQQSTPIDGPLHCLFIAQEGRIGSDRSACLERRPLKSKKSKFAFN